MTEILGTNSYLKRAGLCRALIIVLGGELGGPPSWWFFTPYILRINDGNLNFMPGKNYINSNMHFPIQQVIVIAPPRVLDATCFLVKTCV